MRLTSNFTREEFDCKCGCGFNEIALHFVQKLQQLREEVKFPLSISSGCRCPVWNEHEGGKDNSAHLMGLAADIVCTNSLERFKIVAIALALGFRRIGITKSFVHLDMGENLPHPRIWVY